MKKYIGVVLAAVLLFATTGCGTQKEEQQQPNTQQPAQTGEVKDAIIQAEMPKEGEEIAVMTTSEGVIKMRLFPEEAPKAVENFKTLAKEGYYDGLIFHRVIQDFMIQGGDPTGTGAGGESMWGEAFADEVSPNLHFYNGALAMANSGPNTNGSQFFIVQQKSVADDYLNQLKEARDNNEEQLGLSINNVFYPLTQLFPDTVLNYYKEHGGAIHLEYIYGNPYTIFGQVIEGMDTVDNIAAKEVNAHAKPLEDITIESITFEPYTAK